MNICNKVGTTFLKPFLKPFFKKEKVLSFQDNSKKTQNGDKNQIYPF
jgi:hypothetical protein